MKTAPTISTLSSGSGQSLTAYALGVEKKDEKFSLISSDAKAHLALLELSLPDLLANWPDFSAKAGEILEIPGERRLYLVGTGASTLEDIRKASAALARKVKGSTAKIYVALSPKKDSVIGSAIAIANASYTYSLKSKKDEKTPSSFYFHEDFAPQIKRALVFIEATYVARDLIHTPANIKTPAWLASEAKRMAAKKAGVSVKVRAGRELAEFGGLQAVGNSAPDPGPRMIEISYAPKGSSRWPHVVLVGKGIVFDTGGISLKRPYDIMIAMKSDMAGAAAVLATTLAMADIKPKVRVTALMMCAANAMSSTAQRPSDVIKHYGGTTSEVWDTDAEGRLVLADGLAYADKKLNPDYLVDVATLTGAATLGLGKQYAAMYSRDPKLARTLHDIGNVMGDRVWHMPLVDDYRVALDSDIADISHIDRKNGFSGGSITAALYLEEFVGERTWVHLDIAGTGRSDVDAGEFVKGGTGFGPRLLIEWIDSLS